MSESGAESEELHKRTPTRSDDASTRPAFAESDVGGGKYTVTCPCLPVQVYYLSLYGFMASDRNGGTPPPPPKPYIPDPQSPKPQTLKPSNQTEDHPFLLLQEAIESSGHLSLEVLPGEIAPKGTKAVCHKTIDFCRPTSCESSGML